MAGPNPLEEAVSSLCSAINHHAERERVSSKALLDQMARALQAGIAQAERIGIADLDDGFHINVYVQMRDALDAAGYEVK